MSEQSKKLSVLMTPRVLLTENHQDYDDFAARMIEEIQPQNIFDELNVRDAIEAAWYIKQLRSSRTGTINTSFRKAILQLLVVELGTHQTRESEAGLLADRWFTSDKAKAELAALLKKYSLDEHSIMALAIKLNGVDLERLGREIAMWEDRRDKAINKIFKRRADDLAERVRAVTQRAIDGDGASLDQSGTA
ncbi:hypothetical protein JQ597_13225 [Bradyrhizobium sp. AUGA SZCCT0177]|uniref:hypothetical protein n=1 Tax=Bradyrhizobium sp. AUGA SZCCT0177 TaxID=2807665 RepID=UPI001BA6E0FD|nr:hypothetical protein [Bradyrhizobium sp. AUGA SZCCT0177]MBR1283001.1 hypothetical protein [Bradyrhizobium sp. AUGA SZCCT0177]